MSNDATPRPYELEDRGSSAYVGDLLGPWQRIVDARRLFATIEERDTLRAQLAAAEEQVQTATHALRDARDELSGVDVAFTKSGKRGLAVDILNTALAALAPKEGPPIAKERTFTEAQVRRVAQGALTAVLKFVESLGLDTADWKAVERGEHATFMGIINRRIDEVSRE